MSLASAIRETFTGFKSLVTGMRITAREATKPIITVQYPHDTLPMPPRFRGHIQLVFDAETGRAKCTACGLCAKACPSGCIELDGLKREGDKRKSVSKYVLDFTKCSLCGSCVEICASDAVEFSKDYNVVALNRENFEHIDLYAKVAAKEKAWAETHPQPVAPPAVAAPVAPVSAAASVPAAAPAASAAGSVAAPAPVAAAAPANAAPAGNVAAAGKTS